MLWWILAAVAALLIVLCRTRLGIQAVFSPGTALVDLTVSLFHIRVFPVGEKEAKKDAKKTKEAAHEMAAAAEKEVKRVLPKLTLSDLREAWRLLWPPLRRALSRTRRGIRVKPLELSVCVGGGEDPAAAAEWYGALHAIVWTGMPTLEQLLVIPDPHIHIGVDFDSPKTVVEGTAAVSIRIGTLLAIGFTMGIPALRLLLRLQKRQKETPTAAKGGEQGTPAAA
ncbi:DUF2953 domain-containing protein [Oscillibacter sp.]|uniref:DUF2953 domain-containing protein n=1 Tax=Oscillibacter sp. TaxID=1945593 RepID=UPI00260AD988|nr:DUF2953 domain-containing protein [Oscillibacter sp.]MDD3346289.1 DUF2953 domain-containing protein [Oscillibacter sp.]